MVPYLFPTVLVTSLPNTYQRDGNFYGVTAIRSMSGLAIVQHKEHLYQLSCSTNSYSWTIMPLKLKKGVSVAVTMNLPPGYTCN